MARALELWSQACLALWLLSSNLKGYGDIGGFISYLI